MAKQKSELQQAQRAYRKAADAYENLRGGSAENPLRAPGTRNDRLDEAELVMLDAEIDLRQAEARAATDDADVQAIARWLADALERCKPALEAVHPAPPVLASFAPAALDAHADALVADAAAREVARKAYAAAVARIGAVWKSALGAQDLLRKQRAAAGARAPRLLITSEGLSGMRKPLGIPYNAVEIDDVCAALRDSQVIANTSALENRRDQLAELIAERAARDELDAERATMTPEQIAFESNWGRGSAREDFAP